MPATIVRDEPALIVAYLRAGTVGARRGGDRSGGPRGRQLVNWDGTYEDWVWQRTNVLAIHQPGDAFALWCAWDLEWRHAWWYINLEEPWRRTSFGYDSRDHDLDLWSTDLRTWEWKDADELAWAVEHGQFTQAEALAIRVAGERALDRCRQGQSPFDRDWDGWRPDPSWNVPVLPGRWRDYEPGSDAV